MHTDCPFCLQNNLLKSKVLATTDQAYVIEALGFSGCFLVIPKAHVEELVDLPDDWWADVKRALASLPYTPKSYNLSLNYGAPAGQTLNHLHFWIVPRKEGMPSSGKGLATLVSDKDAQE